MKSRHLFIVISFLCAGFILFALYLQLVWKILPCPLCVLQRYAFLLVGLCGVLALVTGKIRFSAFLGSVFSLAGLAAAAYQLWIIGHPAIQCGHDPLETVVNQLWPAQWIPVLFKADSLCGDILDPIIGLTPPQWALVWFFIFIVVFVKLMRTR